jgi:hypothetical protein
VLTAEQNLFQAQNSLAGALANIPLGLTAVFRALGGGWQIRVDGNFVTQQRSTRCGPARTGATCSRPLTRRNRRRQVCPVLRISDRRSGLLTGECRSPQLHLKE